MGMWLLHVSRLLAIALVRSSKAAELPVTVYFMRSDGTMFAGVITRVGAEIRTDQEDEKYVWVRADEVKAGD